MKQAPRTRTWAGVAGLVAALLVAWLNGGFEGVLREATTPRFRGDAPASAPVPGGDAGRTLERLLAARVSGEVVEGSGRVRATLPDDRDGSRHQRFILELDGGQTVLVSHNIDLAPRIDALGRGDAVEFRGQYEWNAKGGVLHWTHRDPAGRRPGGWLRHEGITYR